jgi:hypothetical protein
MDEIIRLVAEHTVEFVIATVAPIALVMLVRALRKAAKATPNTVDDKAVEALADAINKRGEDKRAASDD